MKKTLLLLLAVLSCLTLFLAWKTPDEGMWLLTQISRLPIAEMQKHGLRISPDEIYSPGNSITNAIVLLGGGTSSYISPDGLLLTNHHVAYGAIQSLSSVQEDYLKDGFYAKTRDEELSAPSYEARTVVKIVDVTSKILGAVSDTMSPETRSRSIQAKSRELEKEEKGTSDYDCRISDNFNGLKYLMYVYDVIRDIRLVYAPPTAIGNYGGEVDNWYWPRHTGDFSIMRAYVAPDGKHARYAKENVPYHPTRFLAISAKGFNEGDFAMILGFPGTTYRYRTKSEVQLARDESLPLIVDLFKTRMAVMEAAWKNDRAIEIMYASRWRGLANTEKKFVGVLEGMKRSDILSVRDRIESDFNKFIDTKPELETKYESLLSDIAATEQEQKSYNKKSIVLGQLLSGSDFMRMAGRFNGFAKSFAKDSATGKIKASDASMKDMGDMISSTFKNMSPKVEQDLFIAMLSKAAELPQGQQIEAVASIVGSKTGEDKALALKEFADKLFRKSDIMTKEAAEKLVKQDADDIMDDRFVKFAIEIDKENSPVQATAQKVNAKLGLLRGKVMEAWVAWKGDGLYPDANRTIRFTYGQIASFNPRDAVHYNSVTTLSGVMEKETGVDPFIVPPKLRSLWEKKDFGPYYDPRIKDVPVAFLADLDITGGNSGSPVLNGSGELIGCAFDGNWESVVNDYLFEQSLDRTISVDARYVLFILDKYANAQNILKELTIR